MTRGGEIGLRVMVLTGQLPTLLIYCSDITPTFVKVNESLSKEENHSQVAHSTQADRSWLLSDPLCLVHATL